MRILHRIGLFDQQAKFCSRSIERDFASLAVQVYSSCDYYCAILCALRPEIYIVSYRKAQFWEQLASPLVIQCGQEWQNYAKQHQNSWRTLQILLQNGKKWKQTMIQTSKCQSLLQSAKFVESGNEKSEMAELFRQLAILKPGVFQACQRVRGRENGGPQRPCRPAGALWAWESWVGSSTLWGAMTGTAGTAWPVWKSTAQTR